MSASDVDQLIDVITARVRARLQGEPSAPVAPQPLREIECVDPRSAETCSGCGMYAARRPWSVRALEAEGACRVGAGVDTGKIDLDLARMIDHTLLKADATADEVKRLCE